MTVQNIGQPFRGILETIPRTTVESIEQCSAFDGTWGMKKLPDLRLHARGAEHDRGSGQSAIPSV